MKKEDEFVLTILWNKTTNTLFLTSELFEFGTLLFLCKHKELYVRSRDGARIKILYFFIIYPEVIVTRDQCWFRLVNYDTNIVCGLTFSWFETCLWYYTVHYSCTNICKVAWEFLHAQKFGVPTYKIIPKLSVNY